MTYVRKYDFQPGTRISSSQIDEEFNQLIKAANDLDVEVGLKADKSVAQMYKITPDDGGFKFSLGGAANNLWSVEGNLATFYSNKGTQNNPDTETSFRGLYIGAGSDYGEIIALGQDASIWRNSKVGGVWKGWQKSYDFNDFKQTKLWEGARFMLNGQTTTPSKKLSECRNGWVLVWSDYNDSTNTANDFNWGISYIPKFFASVDSGGNLYLPLINAMDANTISLTGKKVYINDSTIEGHADNNSSNNGTNDVVLRYVYEF